MESATVTFPNGRTATVTGADRDAVLARIDILRAENQKEDTSPPVADSPSQLGDPIRVGDPQFDALRGDRGDAALAIGSSILAEPAAGLAGLISLPFVGADGAVDVIDKTRNALTFEPKGEQAKAATEAIGGAVQSVTEAVRKPVAGLTGLARAPFVGLDQAADDIRSIEDEGVGKFFGEGTTDLTGSPLLGAAVTSIPTAIVALLGIRAANKVSPRIQSLSDDISKIVKEKGLNPADGSPANVQKIKTIVEEFTKEQQARIDAFKEVGIDRPTRAQITRDASDFQLQQELRKKSGRVLDELEAQEATLTEAFDKAVVDTKGQPVTSGSTVVDEVVGRSIKLDQEISVLYDKARAIAPNEKNVGLSSLIKVLQRRAGSNAAANGLLKSIAGDLKSRGILSKKFKLQGKVTVETAEEIRKFINSHQKSTNDFGRGIMRELKSALDDDVLRIAGKDVFEQARKAKASFESGLSRQKLNKFDKSRSNLVRDILENKIDPNELANKITSTKSFRSTDLQQLKDFLQKTKSGKAAFDDLRAQVLTDVKNKAFIGPEDASGIKALSRSALESALKSIGENRLKVLFTSQELGLINSIMKVAKLREPVRGTVLGRGPSAQAVSKLGEKIANNSVIGALFESVTVGKNGKIVLNGRVEVPDVRNVNSPGGLIVPLVAGQQN